MKKPIIRRIRCTAETGPNLPKAEHGQNNRHLTSVLTRRGNRPDNISALGRQALLNIVAVLRAGGAGPEHMVRMTWFVIDRHEYSARLKELGAVYREVIGKNFPAMSCVEVSGLVEDRAKIEIEVTAVLPD